MRVSRLIACLAILRCLSNVVVADDVLDESTAVEKIESLGGMVRRDDKMPGCPVISVDLLPARNKDVTKFNDEHFSVLDSFPSLTFLSLSETEITNDGLKKLRGLKNLKGVRLDNTRITDAGMTEISEINTLTLLSLQDCRITTVGLRHLK